MTLDLDNDEHAEECKGLYFRYRSSIYESSGVITKKETYRPLKRLSCPGCGSRCLHDFFYEDMSASDWTTWRLIIHNALKMVRPMNWYITVGRQTGRLDMLNVGAGA